MQLDPPLGANPESLLATARAVRTSGKAQLVDVNDNPRARARMSGIMACVAIERLTGVETIPHLTPRDTTINGLESVLLGAHAEGVRNILAVTGDPPEAGDYPGTHGVYEVDSIGLVELMAKLNRGEDYHGRAIDAPTSFYPGRRGEPDGGRPRARGRPLPPQGRRGCALRDDADPLRPRAARGVPRARRRRWPIPMLVGVWPIRTLELLVRMHNEAPGMVVPEHVQERYRGAGRRRARSAARSGCELIEGARELASGVYVVAPFRQP